MKSALILLSCVAFAAAGKAVLCNKYPPLIGFEIDKVRLQCKSYTIVLRKEINSLKTKVKVEGGNERFLN